MSIKSNKAIEAEIEAARLKVVASEEAVKECNKIGATLQNRLRIRDRLRDEYYALRWQPLKKGLVYCAPACGANCTFEAFEKAKQDAAALCERMGKGWKPRVWENMGWYYEAQKGCASVHPDRDGEYTVFINSTVLHNPPSKMGYMTQFIVSGKDPKKAFAQALKKGHAFVAAVTKDLGALE